MRPPLKFARWCKAPSVRPRCKVLVQKVLVQKVLVQSNASMRRPDAVQSSSPRATRRRRANPRAKCPCSASMSCKARRPPRVTSLVQRRALVQSPRATPQYKACRAKCPHNTPPSPPKHTALVQFPATPHGGADHLYRATPPSCNSPPLHTGALSLPSNPTIMQYPAPPLGGADGHHRAIPRPATRGR